ncbi:MAG: ATP-dependent zinc protease family protein [Verrucomicrobiales bacterium]
MARGSVAKIGVDRLVVGWREWLALPGLGIPAIKAKVDTGARTSSIHAQEIEPFSGKGGREWLRFKLRPDTRQPDFEVSCEAPASEHRQVRSSSGHPENRFFIVTTVAVGGVEWEIEVSLSCRKQMKFRMLLGREALRGRCLVEPHSSYLTGKGLSEF